MKAPALFAIGLLALSACGKKETRTASQIEGASLRKQMADQKAARERVVDAAENYLHAVNEAAMARRGVSVYSKLAAATDKAHLGFPPGVDLAADQRKTAEANARAAETKDAFYQAVADYDLVAIPNTAPLPNYQGAIGAHETELSVYLKQLEGESDSGDRLYVLVAKHLDEVLKER